MAGKKGYEATRRMRHRPVDKRGGNDKEEFPSGGRMASEALRYLEWLAVRNYSAGTIEGRADGLKVFLLWAHEREVWGPETITKPILESYQRHLWRYRKQDGKPLSISTQRNRLGVVKDFFSWLCKQNVLGANPASEIEMPRPEKRLPVEALSVEQMRAVLNVPEVGDPLGIRDRTMLEVFYSTGLRRGELAALRVRDLNADRQTLQVRQGKGNKDRVAPVGDRALEWLRRYLEDSRPRLVRDPREETLFLTSYGDAFNPDVISRMVTAIIKKAGIDRGGSCHLLRHTCATHMHDNGADIRFIQQLLGHEKLETTAIYTEVSIEQLKAVHARTHPAENRGPQDRRAE